MMAVSHNGVSLLQNDGDEIIILDSFGYVQKRLFAHFFVVHDATVVFILPFW